jgi:hypothetical protein
MANLLDQASIVLTPTAYDNGKVLCVKPSEAPYGDFDFSRNSAATRVNSQGLVEDVQILSSNLVQNGSFSQQGTEQVVDGSFANGDADWNRENGVFTISGGVANGNGANGGSEELSQNFSQNLTAGKTYKVVFELLNYVSGSVQFVLTGGGSLFGTTSNANGTFTQYVVVLGDNNKIKFRGANFNGSITSISLVEVGQNWAIENTWTIGDGVANGNGVNGNAAELKQNAILPVGRKFKVTYEIKNYVSGTVKAASGAANSGNGIYTDIFISARAALAFLGINFFADITNISAVEITDDTNLPRINYEGFSFDGSGDIIPDSGCGSWLWENQSTNLITYSEDFSLWDKLSGGVGNVPIVTSNYAISPDGTLNASRVLYNIGGGTTISDFSRIRQIAPATTPTLSCYLKSNTSESYDLNLSYSGDSVNVITVTPNVWTRVEYQASATGTFGFRLELRGSYTTDDTADILIWGAQAEDLSYATSYIPTDGTSVTRNQDVCTNGGSIATISSTSGVLYAEIASLTQDDTFRIISLCDGQDENRVSIAYNNVINELSFSCRVNDVNEFLFTKTLADTTSFHKCALSYKLNEFKVYIDGVQENTQLSGSTFPANTLDTLDFDIGNGGFPFFGKTKCLAVWKETLTDTELAELTTI